MPVAIVAIVAMFLFALGTSAGKDPETTRLQAPAEVILTIDPPPVRDIFFPPMPDRNPLR